MADKAPDKKPDIRFAEGFAFAHPMSGLPEAPYVHVAEYLPVQRWKLVVPAMRLSMDVYRFSQRCEGFVAGAIRAKWWRRELYSYTVWKDRDAMLRFVRSGPHAEAAARASELAAEGACYVEWTSFAPPDWDDALARLATPTGYITRPRP